MAIYPESLHMNYPTLYANNTVRIYYENGLVYTYNCNFSKSSQPDMLPAHDVTATICEHL